MKASSTLLSIAALGLAFVLPAAAQSSSQNDMNSTPANSASSSTDGQAEAAQMVPARAAIDHSLDAKDVKPGQTFQAKLASKVRLKDGQELPRGTVLVGKVGQDDMNESGRSKLALCIDQARLKDGKTIPIKATIVGVYGPEAGDADTEDYTVAMGDQVPNDWGHSVLQVDQIGALSGVDLHSKIGSQNSGVLVSTKKDDIKLKTGTELALAVGPPSQNESDNQNNGSGGGR